MENLSSFEKGVLMALTSIAATLRSTPGFDGEALTKAAEYFMATPPPGCGSGRDKELYEWPLAVLRTDLSQLQNALNEGKTKN